ncbi:MAG: hypothetical protein ABIG89_03610 [Candidatus Woesearchaeota archaeon]
MPIDDKIKEDERLGRDWNIIGRTFLRKALYSILAVGVIGFSGMFCYNACSSMMSGEATDVAITRTEDIELKDFDTGLPISDVYVIHIENRKYCITVPYSSRDDLKEGIMLKYISWDFNPIPFACNDIDTYELLDR